MISQQKVKEFNERLAEKNLTIFCAESITAGLLSSTIASVSGASKVLAGSIITYDERVKTSILGVSQELLKEHTAESKEVTNAMCEGLQKCFPGVDIYVAVTGVASQPVTDYKIIRAVGQIYVSVRYEQELHEFEDVIATDSKKDQRNAIREKSVCYIMDKIMQLIAR